MRSENESQSDVPYRRRGRPTGSNRVPLSLEERRARNALYERERRNEAAEATAQLAEAAGCDPNISNADLLATVIAFIQNKSNNKDESIEDLARINAKLESQIAILQERLGLDDESFDQLDEENFQPSETASDSSQPAERPPETKTRKRKRRSSTGRSQQAKRAHTRLETSPDSGVEVQQGVSPTATSAEPVPLPVGITEEFKTPTYGELQADLFSDFEDEPVAVRLPPPDQQLQRGLSNIGLHHPNLENEFLPVDTAVNLLTEDEFALISGWLEDEQSSNSNN